MGRVAGEPRLRARKSPWLRSFDCESLTTSASNPAGAEPETDDQLVERCRSELPYQTAAFEVLAARHEPVLFAVCTRFLRDRHEAEEAVQDVLLRAFHALPRFEGRSSLKTWLYRIAVNVCATRGEKLTREREKLERLAARAAEDEAMRVGAAPPPPPRPEEEFDPGDGPAGRAMRSLAEDDQRVLALRHMAGLSFEELADLLGLKLSTTKMRLYRAEERFREVFAQLEQGGGEHASA